MRRDLVQAGALALAFLGGTAVAIAQQPPPPADGQQQTQQEKAQQTPSGKAGTEEPSAHAPAGRIFSGLMSSSWMPGHAAINADTRRRTSRSVQSGTT